MYKPQNIHTVEQDQILHWTMQGLPGENRNIEFELQVHFVTTEVGYSGITLNPLGTQLPDEISVGSWQWQDTVSYEGQRLWLAQMGGLCVFFDHNLYQLFGIMEVATSARKGLLYFHNYPPKEFGGGDIVYSDDQWLEST